MQTIIFSFAFVLTVAAQNCNKHKAQGISSCIQQKIEEIKREPKWNPPAEVHEYLYKGKKVFLFSSNCCDQFNPVYDDSCNYICAPSGGITGKGDGRCPDFNAEAKHVKLVWKDERASLNPSGGGTF